MSNSPLPTLDPEDFPAFRAEAHRILDAMLDDLAGVADGPVWRRMPDDVRASFEAPLPVAPTPLAEVFDDLSRRVLPYGSGNRHPGFVGWVQGGGTPVGMLAEMIAAGLNANVGGRDHAPVEVERQIVRWMRSVFSFPEDASGIVVTGTSMANFMAVLIAKTQRLGKDTRKAGLAGEPLVAYTSRAAHGCVIRAMELSGLGSDALRLVPTGPDHRIDIGELRAAITRDRAQGKQPFLLIGTAGTVDVGAMDDLQSLAGIARDERLWLHVDGAFGALAALSPELRDRVSGIECADSLAFDFHKWLQVPYDAGFLLVRDAAAHRDAFASEAHYLARAERGLAAGAPWFTDFGPELSRGFRALKVWFTLQTFGTERLGRTIAETCRLARHLAERVRAEPALELLVPPALNVVCFRYRHADATRIDEINDAIVVDLQETGVAAPSTTRVDGKLAIRAAIVNHRVREKDLDRLVDGVLERGLRLGREAARPAAALPARDHGPHVNAGGT